MGHYAQRHMDGKRYVRVSVTFVLGDLELANHLWNGLTSEFMAHWSPEMTLPSPDVRDSVRRSIRLNGWDAEVGEDETFVNGGGLTWALEQVKRVYKFPEEG